MTTARKPLFKTILCILLAALAALSLCACAILPGKVVSDDDKPSYNGDPSGKTPASTPEPATPTPDEPTPTPVTNLPPEIAELCVYNRLTRAGTYSPIAVAVIKNPNTVYIWRLKFKILFYDEAGNVLEEATPTFISARTIVPGGTLPFVGECTGRFEKPAARAEVVFDRFETMTADEAKRSIDLGHISVVDPDIAVVDYTITLREDRLARIDWTVKNNGSSARRYTIIVLLKKNGAIVFGRDTTGTAPENGQTADDYMTFDVYELPEYDTVEFVILNYA